MGTDVAQRNEKGQFLPGQSGNENGRPVGKKSQITEVKQTLELALRENIDQKQMQKIINKMVDMAADGNVGAAKLIIDKVLPNARSDEDAHEAAGGWTFVVKNATFQQKPADNVIEVTQPSSEDE